MAIDRTSWPGLAAAVGRRSVESINEWRPRRIGPQFRWLDHDSITLLDGKLAGREFGIKTDILRSTAGLTLSEGGTRIGHVSIERTPPGTGVVLRDIAVSEALRGNGLAAVMTWLAFRELVQVQETSTFRIRMARSPKAGRKDADVQNVGIGVIAARLGLEPEIDLTQAFDTRNIGNVGVIPKRDGVPPGLRIELRSTPPVLAAFLLDPDTMHPLSEEEMYVRLKRDCQLIREWALAGRLVISNGDYVLRRAKTERFADLLATDAQEARLFRLRVRGS